MVLSFCDGDDDGNIMEDDNDDVVGKNGRQPQLQVLNVLRLIMYSSEDYY